MWVCLAAARYGTYRKVQGMPGGERLVAFTRIMHRQTPDVLMEEVRTEGLACLSMAQLALSNLWMVAVPILPPKTAPCKRD